MTFRDDEQDLQNNGTLIALYHGYEEDKRGSFMHGYVQGYQYGKPQGMLIATEKVVLSMSRHGYAHEEIAKIIDISVYVVEDMINKPLFEK